MKHRLIGAVILYALAFTLASPNVFGACGDERDAILKEYAERGRSWHRLVQISRRAAGSQFFTYKQLTVNEPYAWALLRGPLIVTKEKGYGLDKWREEYGGPRITNSVYRSPVKNEAVGGAPQSRHMYGDAADLRNQSGQDFEYDAMVTAAQRAKADYIEPVSGPCRKACVHADWRDTSGDYHK